MKRYLSACLMAFSLFCSVVASAAQKSPSKKVGDPPYAQLQTLVKKGLFHRARALLERSRAQWPLQLWHANMGAVLIRLGKMEAAAQHLEAALMADARSAAIWTMLKGVRSYQARSAYKELFPRAAGPERVNIALLAPPKKKVQARPVKTSLSSSASTSVPASTPARSVSVAAPAKAVGSAEKATPSLPSRPPGALQAALEQWRAAWSAQDVPTYLRAYARGFHAPGTRDHMQWVLLRTKRLEHPEFIRITLRDIRWQAVAPGRWRVRFRQQYASNLFRDEVEKQLEWQRQPDGWKIISEEVVR